MDKKKYLKSTESWNDDEIWLSECKIINNNNIFKSTSSCSSVDNLPNNN